MFNEMLINMTNIRPIDVIVSSFLKQLSQEDGVPIYVCTEDSLHKQICT